MHHQRACSAFVFVFFFINTIAIIPMSGVKKTKINRPLRSFPLQLWKPLTCFLNCWHSSGVRVSALAIIGMTLTFSCNRFMNSMSKGFSLQRDKVSAINKTSTHKHCLTASTLQPTHLSIFIFTSRFCSSKNKKINKIKPMM